MLLHIWRRNDDLSKVTESFLPQRREKKLALVFPVKYISLMTIETEVRRTVRFVNFKIKYIFEIKYRIIFLRRVEGWEGGGQDAKFDPKEGHR